VLMTGDDLYDVWGDLYHAVESGESAVAKRFGRDFFERIAGDLQKSHIFDRAMEEIHGGETQVMLEHVNAAGIRADTFHVMSGYRTPYYNRSIGNVKYSRHVYGGAADIFIDEQPQDGMMDDLNKDGKSDVYDAGVLYDLIDKLYGTDTYKSFVGGLGRYKKTSAHGPFVHVDVRGFRARWGD